jgi:hypothetical protein
MAIAFIPVAAAQETGNDEASVSVILKEFEEAWNDDDWGPSQGKSGNYMRPMDDLGWRHRMAAFQTIVRNGASGGADLVKALESKSTPMRAFAAQALGYSAHVDAQPALARVVEHDPDAMVRLYAADSLGMLGGGDYDELLRRIEPDEKNRDTKRHIGYALDREGHAVDAGVASRLREWDLAGLGSATLNQPAPDFELASVDGQQVRLSQFRGQQSVVLLFVYGDT